MGCGISTTTSHRDDGVEDTNPPVTDHQASFLPRTDSVHDQQQQQHTTEAPPSENNTSLEDIEPVDPATIDSEIVIASAEMGSTLPPFPPKVSKYKQRFPGNLDGTTTAATCYDEDATPLEEAVTNSGLQNSSSVGGLSTILNGSHLAMGGSGMAPQMPGPFSLPHCEESSSTGPDTPMSMSSSRRSGNRRRAKRTSCDGRPMLFKSVLEDGAAESSPSSNPLGKNSAPQSGDPSTRSRTNTIDAGGDDSDASAFATFGGIGGGSAILVRKQQSSSFTTTTNPSSPSVAHPPADNFPPHSPFFTGNSSNNNQRAPKGWEKVNVARNGSVDSNLDTSGILGSSMMKSSINHRGRPVVCGGTKSLPSIDQSSPHSLTLVPTTVVGTSTCRSGSSSSALPPIQNNNNNPQRKRGGSTSVVVTSVAVANPADIRRRRRSSRVHHGGGRLPVTLMSSSSGSLESLLLSDTELQNGVDEVFASSAHFVPAAAQPVPTPSGSPLISPSLMRSTTSDDTHTDDHHILDAGMSTPPPPPHRKTTSDTLAFGAKSETQFPRGMSEESMRRSSFPAVVSPGLPPVAPPSCTNYPPPRSLRLPSTDATGTCMFYGGTKRMSESSGTTTVNNHSLALTDVSIGRGGWGMSSSTTSVSQIKENPQMF